MFGVGDIHVAFVRARSGVIDRDARKINGVSAVVRKNEKALRRAGARDLHTRVHTAFIDLIHDPGPNSGLSASSTHTSPLV